MTFSRWALALDGNLAVFMKQEEKEVVFLLAPSIAMEAMRVIFNPKLQMDPDRTKQLFDACTRANARTMAPGRIRLERQDFSPTR